MNLSAEAIRDSLCHAFCGSVEVTLRGDSVAVALPMSGRDGDGLMAYVSPRTGGFRISDMGATMMRLSYEHDLPKLLSGARSTLYRTILSESGLQEEDGEIFLDVPAADLTHGLFVLGQGLTRIEDVGLWTRVRVESTFYDDLRDILSSFLPAEQVHEAYTVPGVPDADLYPVDYFIETRGRPLYLMGVKGTNKARLATIILQHLQKHQHRFESLIVCANIDELPRLDRNRLLNAANDVVPSILEAGAIRQKIEHRLSA